ncbi:MAG TPA: hypothetical protein PK303_06185 [bacterium]|nr:hypothetical protein [bacterium]HPP08688.1 hypothetical protein [bacterium]
MKKVLLLVFIIILLALLEHFMLKIVQLDFAVLIDNYFFLFVFVFSIFTLFHVFWSQKFQKIGAILAGAFGLLLLYTAIQVALNINMGQAEFEYLKPMLLIAPLRDTVFFFRNAIVSFLEKFINYNTTKFGGSVYCVVWFFLSFLIPLTLIGCSCYYLLGKDIELTIKNFRTARVLSIVNIATLILLIFILILCSQWKQIAQWHQMCFASMKAKDDFENGKIRFYEIVKCETSYYTGKKDNGVEIWTIPHVRDIGIPARIDEKNFVHWYNETMKNLVRKNISPSRE